DVMRVLLGVLLVGIAGCGGGDNSPDDVAAPSSSAVTPVKAENAEAGAPKTKPVNSDDVPEAEPKDLAQAQTDEPTDVPSDRSSDEAVAALVKSENAESAGTTAEAQKVRVLETPGKIRFGVLGDAAAGPAPTLFVIGGQLEATLNRIDEKNWNQVLRVVDHGVLCVTLDAPCHGQERKPGEPQGLWGWRHRLERGDNWVPGHIANLSAVLDYLVDQKMADPGRVGACGISRGGFVVLHWAAAEPRVRCVAGIAPVTHLPALREFRGLADHPLTLSLSLNHLAKKLVDRPLWLTIGNNDHRVGTEHCVSLVRHIVEATRAARPIDAYDKKPVPAELRITPVPIHTGDVKAHVRAREWILKQLGVTNRTSSLSAARGEDAAGASRDIVLDIGSRLELFVDGFLVESMKGVTRKLHSPQPKDVALKFDSPWDGACSHYGTLFQDGDKFRMYYRGLPVDFPLEGMSYGDFWKKYKGILGKAVACYAESTDGVHWEKPNLGLFAHESTGRKDTNIILTKTKKWPNVTDNLVVFKDANPNCPPDARYKALGRHFIAPWHVGNLAFRSSDGLRWKLIQEKPIYEDRGHVFDAQNVVFWDPLRELYVEYHRKYRKEPGHPMNGLRDV
ncbi:MAG TPA: hypothetical protein DCG16_09015, partial [Gemmatimonadetes bacterium]|nr:hypothetical protein [Gemmatimonadota bacterium]